VNCAGPHSHLINELAGIVEGGQVTTRPLRQEVHHLNNTAPFTIESSAPVTFDGDLGTYFRPDPGGGLLVGGMEPECDPLDWVEDPDRVNTSASVAVYEAQTTRLARRMPELQVPPRPRGVVGVYDVSNDWIPIYDKTSLGGYYVAIGTSGNQFKNAPVIGQLMQRLIDEVGQGHPHDTEPVVWTTPQTSLDVSLGHYSRLREVNSASSFSVLG
jgi:sarcosine oxidase, subunit beta